VSDQQIRPRAEDDLEDLVTILAEVHLRDHFPMNWPEQPAQWVRRASGLGAWVAELDGRLVGHVGLSSSGDGNLAPRLWSDRTGTEVERTAVVTRLFVAGQARGHGIGALLLGAAVSEAERRGLHPVLDVESSNLAAVALYERLGWERMATLEQRWGAHTVAVHCYTAP
jgi:GNAT superfamily N-acetyltransferase